MHFNDKIVWITGASSGIGASLSALLAARKAKLLLTGRDETALQRVKEQCMQSTSSCSVLPVDMLQPPELYEWVQKAIDVYGVPDLVIFSAGRSQRSLAMDTSEPVYRELMELNFFAPMILTKKLLPHFHKRGSGHIVVIGSMAGLMGFPLRTGYAASKHALKGFYETLQTENNIPGVNVTIISPGRVQTPISVNAVSGNGEPYGRMDTGQLNGIPVDECARRILSAIQKKKKHVIIAQNEKFLWWLWWFCRRFYYRIAREKGMTN
jgi:dehydrogenase/reductase SDR family member 7B